MSNFQIYKKTLCFSLRKLAVDFLTLIILAGLCVGGFFIADKVSDRGLIGLAIGFLVGIVVIGLIGHFISYIFKAGQIAMMTKGVSEDSLPDDVYAEGKAVVKERFATVAAYFAVTKAIKGIFNQIGNAITAAGKAIGGDTGQGIGSAISAAIQVLIAYLCDCCLGWVFYRKDKGAVRATCEGAVLFFKHGKTLLRNMGRIYGMGIASFAVIGGSFFGLSYLIFSQFSAWFVTLSKEIGDAAVRLQLENFPEWLKDPNLVMLAAAGIIGVFFWSFLHSAFIRPFVLTGVLRNYILSGKDNIPTEESFAELEGKSKKFAALRRKIED